MPKFVKIPKRSGGHRLICCPSKAEKHEQGAFSSMLRDLCLKHCDLNICHAFLPFHSPVTHAKIHVGKIFTFSLDIKDFFDSVRIEMVEEYFNINTEFPMNVKCSWAKYSKQEFFDINFIKDENGIPRTFQGMINSPFLSQISSIKMVEEIRQYIVKKNIELDEEIVFSVYADNYDFSFNKYEVYPILKEQIPLIINKYGFQINPNKYHLQSERFGRKVTGINIKDNKLRISRKVRNRIRVLKYKINQLNKKIELLKTELELTNLCLKEVYLMCVPSIDDATNEEKIEICKNKVKEIGERCNAHNKEIAIYSKQLKSLEEWSKLKFPLNPVSKTKKILLKFFDYLDVKNIFSNNQEPGLQHSQFNTYRNSLKNIVETNGYSHQMAAFIKSLYNSKILKPDELKRINNIIQNNEYLNNITNIVPSITEKADTVNTVAVNTATCTPDDDKLPW